MHRDKWLLELAAVPDGRECKLCFQSDESQDPIHKQRCRRWGFAPKGDPPRNQGSICFVCMKTYKARFLIRFKTFKLLLEAIAEDNEVKEEFECLAKFCLDLLIKVRQGPKRDWASGGGSRFAFASVRDFVLWIFFEFVFIDFLARRSSRAVIPPHCLPLPDLQRAEL